MAGILYTFEEKKGNPRIETVRGFFYSQGSTMRSMFSILFIMFLHSIGFTQSPVKVTGRVTEAQTGIPLPDINIAVSGTAFGTSTDQNGMFLLENIPQGEYRIAVSGVGYEPAISRWFRVIPGEICRVDVVLRTAIYQSPELLVEAERDNLWDADASSFIHTITRQDIELGGFRSVGEALETVPGLFVQKSGGAHGTQYVSIRGSKTEHVLVLVDGVRFGKPHGGSTDLSMIPLSMIEKIDVVKGGNSARYGADALAGVIVITTKSARPRLPQSVRGSIGSFGSNGFQGHWNRQSSTWGMITNYEHQHSDGTYAYTNQTGERDIRRNADFSSDNLYGKITYRNGHLKWVNAFHANRNVRGLPGFLYNLTPDARSLDWQRIASSQLQVQMRGGLITTYHLSYHYNKDEDRQKSLPVYHTVNTSRSLTVKGKIRKSWFHSYTSFLEYSFRHDKADLENVALPRMSAGRQSQRISTWNAVTEYAKSFQSFVDEVTGTGSLGFGHKHGDEGFFTPKMGIAVQFNSPVVWSLQSNWSRSFHLPDFYDLYYEGYRASGNPELKPERGVDFDIGITIKMPLYGFLTMQSTYFKNHRNNMIHWRQRFDGLFYPFNIARVHITGTELGADWQHPSGWLQFHSSYTYLHAVNKGGERTTHNKQLTNTPVHTANNSIKILFGELSTAINHRYVGKRFIREANSKWLDPYHVIDITGGYSIPVSPLSLLFRIGVYNVANKPYSVVERAPMPGREYRFSTTVEF